MNRTESIIIHINRHYKELQSTLEKLNNDFDNFINNIEFRKSILLDVIENGELVNKLPKELQSKIQKKDLVGSINLRNHIVHGYEEIDYFAVWDSVILGMPGLVEQINKIWIRMQKMRLKNKYFYKYVEISC